MFFFTRVVLVPPARMSRPSRGCPALLCVPVSDGNSFGIADANSCFIIVITTKGAMFAGVMPTLGNFQFATGYGRVVFFHIFFQYLYQKFIQNTYRGQRRLPLCRHFYGGICLC